MPSNSDLLIGIDLGSSGVKAILLSPEVGILASVSEPVDLFSDEIGWAEADPHQWWVATCSLIQELALKSKRSLLEVSAIAVSGMVPAVLTVDANGNPLRRAILQNDARATTEIDVIKENLGDLDLLSLTGSVLSQQSVAPTALWLAHNESDLWLRTFALMGSYDWLALQLGAELHVEKNWAIESGLYNLDLTPLEQVQIATRIDWPLLPPVKSPGDKVGVISVQAAKLTGLSVGTSIIVGGADHVLSAYGAGLIDAGDCLIKLGGAGDILAVTDEIHLDARLYLDSHPAPGKWLPNGCMATSGSLLRWEQGIFGGAHLEELDKAAAVSKPGALISLPYFLGEKTPLHDPDLRGGIIGMHLGTTRGDIHRSFLEAIAYGFKAHGEVFAEGGLILKRIRVTNGGSKSRLWRTILADVLDRELHSIVNHPGASFGAAVIAGIGIGAIDDWSFVLGALEAGEMISPNPVNVAIYQERYEVFQEFSTVTTPIAHRIARS
ncbi:MAG: FGGY family carbohydrate kinase [Actinomycetes bacterium]